MKQQTIKMNEIQPQPKPKTDSMYKMAGAIAFIKEMIYEKYSKIILSDRTKIKTAKKAIDVVLSKVSDEYIEKKPDPEIFDAIIIKHLRKFRNWENNKLNNKGNVRWLSNIITKAIYNIGFDLKTSRKLCSEVLLNLQASGKNIVRSESFEECVREYIYKVADRHVMKAFKFESLA